MTEHPLILWTIRAAVTAVALFAVLAEQPRTVSELLSQLAKGPVDQSVFAELENQQPEPRVILALADAFQKRQVKQERQWIALTALRLGDTSQRYLDLLMLYAKDAIEDRTPLFFAYGPTGEIVRGKTSPEFEQWCRDNHQDAKAIAATQFLVQPSDVRMLAKAEDSRAVSLLRRGLDSPNPLIIYYSAEGLAWLNDEPAINMVVRSCERLPNGTARFVATSLAEYLTPTADLAMERFVQDPNVRAEARREAVRTRTDALKRKLVRRATPLTDIEPH
jgi:hypothetical protein